MGMTDGNWIALAAVIAFVMLPLVGSLIRVATLLGKIAATLQAHDQRLETLEAAAVDGRQAARRVKQSHELGDAIPST